MAQKPKYMTADEWRERCRLDKRRLRARRYAAGLDSRGRARSPQMAALSAAARLATVHPDGCPCYDCLWPTPDTAVVMEREAAAWQLRRMVRR